MAIICTRCRIRICIICLRKKRTGLAKDKLLSELEFTKGDRTKEEGYILERKTKLSPVRSRP